MLAPYQENLKGRIAKKSSCLELTGFTCKKLIGLTGIYGISTFDDIEYWNITGTNEEIVLVVLHEDLTIKRTIYRKSNFLYNDLLVSKKKKKSGLAYKILRSQVGHAMSAGLTTIECQPWGNLEKLKEYNGYITWGKMGYIMDEESQAQFLEIMLENGRSETKISELLKSEDGLKLWTEKGESWYGIFDLNPDSESVKILREYATTRGLAIKPHPLI